MRMIRRGHDHCLDVLLLVKHRPEIGVPLGRRELAEGPAA